MDLLRSIEEQTKTLQANLQLAAMGQKAFMETMEETKHPMDLQKEFLLSILQDNKDTEYGRKYGFSDIHSIEEYQAKVPVSVWADFEPYMDRMVAGEQNVLTVYPFDHFNITSGTSGKPKHIPYTKRHMDAYVKYNSYCGIGLLKNVLDDIWCSGRAFSPNTGELFKLPSGLTEGHIPAKIAEYLGGPENADAVTRISFTSPVEATAAAVGKDTRYIHCRFALEDRDITGINVMYFPMLLTMFEYIDKHYALLINDIEKGTIDESIQLPDDCRESLSKKIKPMPERAAELREIFKNGTDFPYITSVWPKIKYIFGCKGGSFASYDRILRERYSGDGLTRIYYGVTATEGIFSTPFKEDSAESVLTPGSLFMEFLPVEADGDFSRIVTMDKLEKGKLYEAVITNAAGLYRYRMSDCFEITGWLNETPTINFVGRVNKTMNICAEKIMESDIEKVVEQTSREAGMPIFDFCVYPDYDNMRYAFLVEPERGHDFDLKVFGDLLEKNMEASNDVYRDHVNIYARMKPLSIQRMQESTCLLYLEVMEYKGASASTIKPVHVISTAFQKKFFTTMVEGDVYVTSAAGHGR